MTPREETQKHIDRVRCLLTELVCELLQRARMHDDSKLHTPEAEIFEEYTPKLKDLTFGSPEYYEMFKPMRPALNHHYANNSHHPEFYHNGINDMSLIDLVEMLCDWRAATERHADGNIYTSLENNIRRFDIDPQLAQILKNTVDRYLQPDKEQ